MTTIVGIRVPSEDGGIVIAPDIQKSIENREDGTLEEKVKYYKKIVIGKTWALAHAGGIDDQLSRFLRYMSGHKRYGSNEDLANSVIERAVMRYSQRDAIKEKKKELFEKPHFEEVNLLNAAAKRDFDGNEGEEDDSILHTFLLATISPQTGLWYVDSHGNLIETIEYGDKEFQYLCIGSGRDMADSYIENLLKDDNFDPENIDIPKAIDILYGSLQRAERNIYTSGPLDLVILTKKRGVEHWGKRIREDITDAVLKTKEEIKSNYLSTSD
ncbi:MAG: hypothetical protein ABIH25_00950 [Candidatus Woesearchaeota archaeon]